MRLANFVQNLVRDKKIDGHGAITAGATIPYIKFADFQRAMASCTDPTGVILICAQPQDAIPHALAHATLLGISFSLLNDDLSAASGSGSAAASGASSPSLLSSHSGLPSRYAGPAMADAVNERSILDTSAVRAATPAQVVDVIMAAAQRGSWIVLPEVSAMGLPVWTEVGRFLAAASAAAAAGPNDEYQYSSPSLSPSSSPIAAGSGLRAVSVAAAAAAASSSPANKYKHVTSVSPHFRFITFITDKSAALGRTLSPKIAQSVQFVDTRGVVRSHQELSALLSALVPLPEKQLVLLSVGVGDGRISAADMAATSTPNTAVTTTTASGAAKTSLNLTGNTAATFSPALGSATQPVPTERAPQSPLTSPLGAVRQDGTTRATTAGGGAAQTGASATFFVDWPCAAAYARAPVTIHTSDIATTSDYVDGALFALRETLLRNLRDLTTTAAKLDQQEARARKAALEARAIRTGHDLSELEQIDEMRNRHKETNMARLEKNPAWIYPAVHDWLLGCAPSVSVERLPFVSFEELTVDEVLWVHEGVGDATACLRGTYQLAPVSLQLALPSVRPSVTASVNNKLLVSGRTMMALRHPAVLQCFGVSELPADMSTVQGGNTVLRPLLSAAAMHERWLDAQDEASTDDIINGMRGGGGGGGSADSGTASPLDSPASPASPSSPKAGVSASSSDGSGSKIRQYALITEPFEMSLEQLLVASYDRSRPWTAEQMLDVALSILRALVHISDTMVHRAVSPASIVVISGGNALLAAPRAASITLHSSATTTTTQATVASFASDGNNADAAAASSSPTSPTVVASTAASLAKLQQQNRVLLQHLQSLQTQQQRLVCKLSNFASTLPCNRRCAPPWLVAVLAAKLPVRYCAPEAFYGQFSHLSDIWSFGVTLWSMLHYCRRQPFANDTNSPGAVAEAVATGAATLARPGDHVPSYFFDRIILPCVARRPSDRPDARALISVISLLRVQHKSTLQDPIMF